MWHMIEFNGVRHGFIRNCKFENYGTSGNKGTEAVQLDSMISEAQFPWFGNYDITANDHIIIEGNYFTNIGTKCIGGHSFTNWAIQRNIIIQNNKFEDVHTAISINDFENLKITNNISRACRIFLTTTTVNNNCYNLDIIGNTHVGMYGADNEGSADERFLMINPQGNVGALRIEGVNITNNNISSCRGHGIGYTANYVTITNNNFSNIARHGIYHYGGLCGSIANNTFKDTGKEDGRYSIVVGGNSAEPSKAVSVTGNTIANLRGISVNGYSTGVIVCNNVGQVTNNVGASCTVANNMTI